MTQADKLVKKLAAWAAYLDWEIAEFRRKYVDKLIIKR